MNRFAIIEIGSNNTKTHVYEKDLLLYDKNSTIEFKKNYQNIGHILPSDLEKLYNVIEKSLEFTKNIKIYGCSIFRNLDEYELECINKKLQEKYNLFINVVSQKDEAYYTALGCYHDIDYSGRLCVFIGGGGSIELIFVENKKVVGEKFYDFGVVDITTKFPDLKEDVAKTSFDEVSNYLDSKIGNIGEFADVIILSGGNHLYWFNNAGYQLSKNTLYNSTRQKYLLDTKTADKYDHDCLLTSLDKIRANSDNPLWFDGSRAMRMIVNLIIHKINAKYMIPTDINMEDGLKHSINNN